MSTSDDDDRMTGASSADAPGSSASGMRALRPLPSAGRFCCMVVVPAFDQFLCEREVCLGAARLDVVENHRHPMARRLAEAHIARDDGAIDLFLEEATDVGRHLFAEAGPL